MNFQSPEEDDPRDDDQKRSSSVMCRNGQNEFGCKYPDCTCEPLTDDEKAARFAAIAMRTGEGPLSAEEVSKYAHGETMQMGESVADKLDEISLRILFESLASDPSFKFARSRKGTYVNGATARDWKWFQLGAKARKGL